MSLFCVGLNHHTAPLEVREQFSLSESSITQVLVALEKELNIKHSVVVSTCNRCEVYASSDRNEASDSILRWLCRDKQLASEQVATYFYQLNESSTVKHLLRVASSLDSMIVGEPQILGQVKAAYQISLSAQRTNTIIGKLFDHALATAKHIRSTTELGQHRVSYSSVALSLAKKIFHNLATKHALMIGTGEMIESSARQFQEHGIGGITIAGRSQQRTAALASELATQYLHLDEVAEQLHHYDLLISCTASDTPILKKEDVAKSLKKRKQASVCMIDLALPRDIEPTVADLDNVYLYTLDNLTRMIDVNRHIRLGVVSEAEKIINRRSEEFMQWLNIRTIAHLITQLKSQADKHGEQVLYKSLELLKQGKEAEEVLRYLKHTLTAKLTHDSIGVLNKIAASIDKKLLETIAEASDEHQGPAT